LVLKEIKSDEKIKRKLRKSVLKKTVYREFVSAESNMNNNYNIIIIKLILIKLLFLY